jgi:DnaK suppressor protein
MNKSKSTPGTATKSVTKVASDGGIVEGSGSAMNAISVPDKVDADGADKGVVKTKTKLKHAVDSVQVAIDTPRSDTAPEAIASKLESRPAQVINPSSEKQTVDELAGNIEQNAVSKVREVATKTTKSTPAVPTDGVLLSEAQILKMSDKDYMNPAQLAFFKVRLQQLEKDLLKNAGETTEHLRETVLVPDPADRATIEEEHALELRTRDRERKLLKKVQQSIASIESGEYGWCEETGEPIGVPRLLARPTATLSLEAQQRRELKQKLYGD